VCAPLAPRTLLTAQTARFPCRIDAFGARFPFAAAALATPSREVTDAPECFDTTALGKIERCDGAPARSVSGAPPRAAGAPGATALLGRYGSYLALAGCASA